MMTTKTCGNKQDESEFSLQSLWQMLNNISDHGVRTIDPSNRSLITIANREDIVKQNIPFTPTLLIQCYRVSLVFSNILLMV